MPNNIRLDPTRTTLIRRQYMAEMKRRFKAIRSLVIEAVWRQDVLGLDTSEPITFNALPERQAFRFAADDDKVKKFNRWFKGEVDAGILEVDATGKPWTAKYVDSSYRKGSVRAYIDTRTKDSDKTLDFYQGRQSQFLESAFTQPERVSKLRLLYTRSFEELKGITSGMSQKVSRILASGLGQGKSPRTLARELAKSIDGITKTRALTLARTEVIQAHAEGQLDSFEEFGVEGVKVQAEWSTAEDDRVCELCAPLDGTIMTIAEARGLIPRHPNCRCAWIPADVGEKETKKKRFWSKRDKKKQVDKSLKAELPKKTRAGKKVPQTVAEAKKRSTWSGEDLG